MAYQPKSYKKFVATAATATLVASAIVPVASAATFTDVNKNYTEAVNYLVANKIAQGTSDTTFGTTASITRGDAAVMIANALGLDTSKAPESAFTDLNTRVKASVNALSAAGIINGKSTTQFAPDDNITRAEMAKVIALAYKLDKTGTTNEFTDVNSTFDEYVDALVKYEITLGKTESLFGATQNVTRGEFALFVFRAENLTPATPEVVSVSAINATQAVIEFNTEIGEVDATNFTVDNGVAVTTAKINADAKKVTVTFNKALQDNETYKVTTNGVVSAKGGVLEEAIVTEFKYEVGSVNFVSLDQTTFNSFGTGENLLDYVTIKDDKGRDVTSEVKNDAAYTVTVSTTEASIVDATGAVQQNAKGSAYVEIKVTDVAASKVIATTGAVKVTVAPYEFTSLDGIHLSAAPTLLADYKTAKTAGEIDTTMQVSEDGETLNVFAKDSSGTIVKLNSTGAVITNKTPTVATVSDNGLGEFVVDAISAGTAQVEITVGGFKTTVSFTVVADSKVTSGTLDSSALTLTMDTNSPSNTGSVNLKIVDQYGDAIAADAAQVAIRYSKAGVATVTKGTVANNVLPLNVAPDANGTTTVYVDYKAANGSVIFTKSFTVTVKDFGAAAKYDLVVSSSSADYLDADADGSETGVDALDNDVVFSLYQVDAAGNRVAAVPLDGTTNALVLDLVALTDAEEALLDQASIATGTLSFADAVLAQQTLKTTGTVKVSAQVGGVTVDSVNVSYKNTDSVASSASVTKTSTTVDMNNLPTVDQILFGKYGTSSYTISPVLSVKDQNGKVLTYDIATSGGVAIDELYNGLTVDPTWTVTNLSNVTVAPDGTIALAAGKTSGTFTLVLAKVETTNGVDAINEDLLAAPVAINVTVVE